MSDKPFDPIATWADMVQKWEQEINSWSGKLTESEQFSSMMGGVTRIQLIVQRSVAEQMEGMLRTLNMPSKVQIEALTERLDAIEDSIDRLRLAVEARALKPGNASPAEAVPVPPEPKRTRQPTAAPTKKA
ncbi:hypothetical protein OLX02_07890 [Novosphingobium sp. KCTC 2891]|uniref:hypothetical protein n=1 Tax=Novosphingobium sp. KCTC 2891 TaxID=2989730 RepID=UPI0022220E2E|nr:hypothetical protein [Novosphingobium sp. KCTC 2891]MCW1382743.1 hypothetical protein [Novosphingobium sp. KCTC 2891]